MTFQLLLNDSHISPVKNTVITKQLTSEIMFCSLLGHLDDELASGISTSDINMGLSHAFGGEGVDFVQVDLNCAALNEFGNLGEVVVGLVRGD